MNWKHWHRGCATGLIACAALWSATAAAAGPAGGFNRLVVFGDSLSDPGNAFVLVQTVSVPPFDLIPSAPYARGGLHFSNGETWVEQLASELNAKRSSGPALRKPLVFSNYAVGGARARATGVFDLSVQTALFLSDSGGQASSDSLYVVFAGGNDVLDALREFDPNNLAPSLGILLAAVDAIDMSLRTLSARGAHAFLVPNAPNIALVPAVRQLGTDAQTAAQSLTAIFNGQLEARLSALEADPNLGVKIERLDVFGILNEVVAAPAAAGLGEVELPCITPETKISPFCAHPDNFLFWDGIHPTRAGHGILARRAAAKFQ